MGFLFRLFLAFTLLAPMGSLLAADIEAAFLKAGLVDIHSVDPSIKVDLVNAHPDKNFFEQDFYDGLSRAYLRKEVAIRLSRAQALLKAECSGCSLQILDAARPRSVSRAMYEKMKGTRFERYVAHPDTGSMHNYGIAVDITIVDENGGRLDMGPSPFFSSHAEIYMNYFLKKVGLDVSADQQGNRDLLSRVMIAAGFYPLSHEWWHFNGMKKDDARSAYSIIE